jgi:pimeloyl-ACP methyl ester carboxylesterase
MYQLKFKFSEKNMKKKFGLALGTAALFALGFTLLRNKKEHLIPIESEKPTPDQLNEKDKNDWSHDYITANGINFHYVTQGSGPLLLLIHGFPESWYSWREQIPLLAEEFKVVAIDMRGYNLTDKPQKIEDYKVEKLVEDIKALIYAFDEEKATVIAHDWGAAVAWVFAMQEPEMLEKLVIMNCPHPAGMFKALKTSKQLLKSWYMLYFQLPVIPEYLMSIGDYKPFAETLAKTSEKPELAFNEEDREHFRESISMPGANTAMINYYRALRYVSDTDFKKVKAPTLLIWGEKDKFLLKNTIDGIENFVPDITIKLFPDASHWVHRDEPEAVNKALKEFLF